MSPPPAAASETAAEPDDSADGDQPDRSTEASPAATRDTLTPVDHLRAEPPAADGGAEIDNGPRTAASGGELPADSAGAKSPSDADITDANVSHLCLTPEEWRARTRAPSDHDGPPRQVAPAKRAKLRGVQGADTPRHADAWNVRSQFMWISVIDDVPQDGGRNPLQPSHDQEEPGDDAQEPVEDEQEPGEDTQPVGHQEPGDDALPVDAQGPTDDPEPGDDRQLVDDHEPRGEQEPVGDEQQFGDLQRAVDSRLDVSGWPGDSESHDLWNRDLLVKDLHLPWRWGAAHFLLDSDDPNRHLRPARLAAAKGSRLLALCGIVALALCLDWGVVVALDLSEPIRGGLIAGSDLDRLNRVRRWVNIVLMLSLAAQALWAFTVSLRANRAGVGHSQPTRCVWLADVTVLCVAGGLAALLTGMAPIIPALLVLVASALAWWSVMSVVPVAEWAEVPITSVRLWATGQVLVTLVHLATGGIDDIPADASIKGFAFLGVALGLVAAVTAIVAGFASWEIEDSLRGSTKIAAGVAAERNDPPPPSMAAMTAPAGDVERQADAALRDPQPATGPPMAESERSPQHGRRVDINAGSTEELAQVPGIGAVTAQRIVEHRESNGSFDSVNDLFRVAGLGRRRIDQLAPYLAAGASEPDDRSR